MKILGLNGWTVRGHDGGASLLVDGKLKFAIEEERLVGVRHAYDMMPKKSIEVICNEEKISIDDLDRIVIGWDYPNLWKMFGKTFLSKKEMSSALFGTDKYDEKLMYIEHHKAHAYSAFYPSNFKRALVLVIDGQGEYIATSVFVGDRTTNTLKKIYETPVSLGYFYAAVTEYIGFYSGQEGKTMGLASYGKPVYIDELKKHINVDTKGGLICSFSIKKKNKDEEEETIERWKKILNEIIPFRKGTIEEVTPSIIPYANLAASAQKLLEEIISKIITFYCNKYKLDCIAIAGGVGLNCALNGFISKLKVVKKVFTQPAANDGGISLGAAIAGALDVNDEVSFEMIPYLGNRYEDDEIKNVLLKEHCEFHFSKNLAKEIAELVSRGYIVANFQGRLEYGPRALGNRSLLADPRKKEMLVKLNSLKGRELWRPLAPAVLYEKQTEYFDTKQFSPYMTINCEVLENVRSKLEAVTHVDGTARIQSVTPEYNSLFYNIISEFYKITGIPVIINTSFNIKGEPIVDSPLKALNSAKNMNLDYLAIGCYIVKLH